MIKVYLDESGIHEDAVICTVAGYAAPWKIWKRKFISEWNRVLRRFGLEKTGLHSKDFFKRAGTTYAKWTEQDTLDCFNQLVGVVNTAELTPVGGSVVTQSFWKLSPQERKWITGAEFDMDTSKWLNSGAPKTPYHLPVKHAIVSCAYLGSPENKVNFVHDRQDQYAPLVLEAFNGMKESLKVGPNLGDMVFSSRTEAVPLQAADMLAFHLTKYAELKVETGEKKPPPSYAFRRLMERRNDIRFFDDYGISLLLAGAPPAIRTTPSLLTEREEADIKSDMRDRGYNL